MRLSSGSSKSSISKADCLTIGGALGPLGPVVEGVAHNQGQTLTLFDMGL